MRENGLFIFLSVALVLAALLGMMLSLTLLFGPWGMAPLVALTLFAAAIKRRSGIESEAYIARCAEENYRRFEASPAGDSPEGERK